MYILYINFLNLKITKMKKYFLLKLTLLTFCFLTSFNSKAADYYWIGGSGNWSDLQHWATTSGGSINPIVVPSPFDNVIFDANSFTGPAQVVTIDQTIVSCLNMDWTGALFTPTLTGPTVNSLKIYGSLKLISAMNFSFQGLVYFEAVTTGKTITTGGKQFINNVYFQGAGGEWIFLDDFSTTNSIYLYNGHLNTNSFKLNCSSLNTSPSNPAVRSLTLGSSLITLSSTSSSALSIYNDNFTFSAGTSQINFTGNGGGLYVSTYFGSYSILTFNNIEFTNTAGTSRIYYNNNYGNLIINKAVFKSHGQLQGNFTFNDLVFSKGKTYELEAQQTQTIINSLTAIGTCNLTINIKSLTSGSQANISKSSGNVIVDYVALRDINATGGATFIANNSVDVSNNSGWTINTSAPIDLYWVGGTGNWDDSTHWSTISGGYGGACVPTVNDNVFFDANSFTGSAQSVNINTNAFCNNINWTGAMYNPTFTGTNTYTLNIYGSLVFINNMNLSFQGRTNFEATTLGKTITSAGKQFVSNVYFQGAGGGWTLLDPFSTSNTIYLYHGTLNTNSQNVSANSFNSSASNPATRSLILGSTTLTLTSTSSSAWSVYNDNFTLDAGTSLIRFTGNGGGLYNSTYFGTNSILTLYNVEFTHTTGLSRIYYNFNYGNLIFNDVIFYGNGQIQANCTINNLTFSKAKYYEFESNRTQTILNTLNSIGTCNEPINMRSMTSGIQAIINKASGSITIEYVALRDMDAQGGAVFTANNSVDISNNTGWIINTTAPLDLYWVGGTGNWDDPAHWSTSSGGAGGACIPTVHDDVFFDNNSFTSPAQSVNINANAYCKNMDWTGATFTPTLTGTSTYSLSIYGSLIFISSMNLSLQSRVNFESTSNGNTITSSGKSFISNVYFQGAGGEWLLTDAFNSNNTIYLINGHLNTNNQLVNCNSINSSSSNPATRSLTLGSSKITLTSSSSSAFSIYNDNFAFDAGTSLISFTGNGSGLYVSTYFGNYTNFAFYDVEFTNSNGTSRLYYNNNYGNLSFNKVIFLSNGTMQCNATYDTLIFSPGRTYQLESNLTQTITDEIIATGLGGFPIDIRSTTSGIQAILSKANGCVVLDFLQLRDNFATGGASWYAGLNSADVDNNNGWNFGVPASLNPPSTINGTDTICPSASINMYSVIPVPNANYIWEVSPPQAGNFSGSGADITFTPDVLFSGNAIIGVKIFDNCDTSMQTQLPIFIGENVIPPLFHGGNSNICQGTEISDYSAISLNATGFLWLLDPPNAGSIINNGSTATILWDTSFVGNVTVYVQTYNNCDTSTSANFPVVINPSPTKPSISQTGSDLISSPAFAYQWYHNGNMLYGETQQSYTPILPGDYFVVIYNQFNCSAFSDTVTITINSINDKDIENIKNITIYPNPVIDKLFIKLSSYNKSKVTIYIDDIKGRNIDCIAFEENIISNNYVFSYNIKHINNGIYLLKIHVNNNVFIKKFIINK